MPFRRWTKVRPTGLLDEVELKPGGETVLLGVLGVLGELGLVDVTGAAGVVVVGGLAAGVGAAVTAGTSRCQPWPG